MELKLQALEKLNQEMSRIHGDVEDSFHNFLCQAVEEDLELVQGILKEGKSIKEAVWFVIDKAKGLKRNGQTAMTTDQQVFNWVREYFVSNSAKPKKDNTVKVQTSKEQKTKAKNDVLKARKELLEKKRASTKKKQAKVEEGQISLFGL